MASTEALSALKKSLQEWENYRLSQVGIIDLKLSGFTNYDFEGRNLSNCDFSGSDLENANLDSCKIYNSKFDNTCLEGVSLVNSNIELSNFKKANLKQIVLREAEISKSHFINVSLEEAEFIDSMLTSNVFSDVIFNKIRMEMTTLEKCKLNNIESTLAAFLNSDFIKCKLNCVLFPNSSVKKLLLKENEISDFDFSDSDLSNVSLINCNISSLKLQNSFIVDMNLSGSLITNANLIDYNLTNTVFLEASVNNSNWPDQKGKITFLGKYIPNANLLGQPVQDIKGLTPSLRREIADAQYLKEKLAIENKISKFFLSIWGLTTGYGQSLIRLTTVSISLILFCTFIFILGDGNLGTWPTNFINGLNAIGYVFSSFLGLGLKKSLILCKIQKIVLFFTRIFGFFILGLWIGLAANKLGKLSAE